MTKDLRSWLPSRPALLAVALAVAWTLTTLGAAVAVAAEDADIVRGERLYGARCGGCHSIDRNRVGPSHRGVVGRVAGSVEGFGYTPALKGAGLVWDDATLDLWLQGPTALVPGTSMGQRLPRADDRRDVIGFLKSVSPADD